MSQFKMVSFNQVENDSAYDSRYFYDNSKMGVLLTIISSASIIYLLIHSLGQIGNIKDQYYLGDLPCQTDLNYGYDRSARLGDECRIFDTTCTSQSINNHLIYRVNSTKLIHNVHFHQG